MTIDAEIITEDPHVVARDRYDARTFQHIREATGDVNAFCNKSKVHETFAGDIFSSLYKMEPKLTEAQSPHRPVIEQMREMPEWLQFRETTRLDKLASSLACAQLSAQLEAKLPQGQGLDKPMWHPPMALPPDGKPMTGDDLRGLLRGVINKVAEDVEEQMEAFAALAGTSAGTGATQDIRKATELFNRVRQSKLLRDIAKLAGRMRRIAARKHAERVRHGPDELADIETGRDLTRVLTTELALLGTAGEGDFYRRFAEGGLLQYRIEGKEPKGRGPIILCLDSSGSMQDGHPYTREVWAKAMALGLMTIAAKERREFVLLTFGTQVTEFRFSAKPTPEKIMEALSFAYHGAGTDFDVPLTRALQIVVSAAERKYQKADIIFLTDGEASVRPDVAQNMKDVKRVTGLKLYTLVIGTTRPSRALEPVSDGMTCMAGTDKDANALDLVFGV